MGKNVITRKCRVCGKDFTMSPDFVQKLEKLHFDYPVRCNDCNKLKKEGEFIVCKQCGETFLFTKLLEKTLRDKYGKKFRKPKFCKKCRDTYREKKGE